MNDPTTPTGPGRYSTNGSGSYPSQPPPRELTDLPPVEAPSAGFIVQLFVIPAVVVLVVICVWLLFGKLAGGERDAMEYVRLIRGSSSNWRAANRAAFELASLIQNDPKLASDPTLLGELTDLLEHDLEQPEVGEMAQYLALAIGKFDTLDAIASTGQKPDPLAVLARALDARCPEPVRLAAAASLAKHAARTEGQLTDPKAVAALAETSATSEPLLREVATFSLGFFGGADATRALTARLGDSSRFVRYNAAVALARRGDPAAAGNLREMLSPADLDRAIAPDDPAGKQAKLESIELEALQALATSLAAGKPELARGLRKEVDALTSSGLVSVRNKAQELAGLLK